MYCQIQLCTISKPKYAATNHHIHNNSIQSNSSIKIRCCLLFVVTMVTLTNGTPGLQGGGRLLEDTWNNKTGGDDDGSNTERAISSIYPESWNEDDVQALWNQYRCFLSLSNTFMRGCQVDGRMIVIVTSVLTVVGCLDIGSAQCCCPCRSSKRLRERDKLSSAAMSS